MRLLLLDVFSFVYHMHVLLLVYLILPTSFFFHRADLETTQQLIMQAKLIEAITASTSSSLSIADARGIVRLFDSFFKIKKGYPRFVSKVAWKQYKHQMYREYNRWITGCYLSELTIIRKYSTPIAFLRHKCKNVHKLTVPSMTDSEISYYKEIGGIANVNELFRRNKAKVEDRFKSILNMLPQIEANEATDDIFDHAAVDKARRVFKRHTFPPMDASICRALSLEEPICAFNQHPHPATRSFVNWLEQNWQQICSKLADQTSFTEQLYKLQTDEQDWQTFIYKWKMWMIFLDQQCEAVLFEICLHLCIPVF